MRRNQYPLRPKADDARMRQPEPLVLPQRKVFNCIVDDTALIAGGKLSTRDGIRKWVYQGAIRLFVPLYTLSQLHRIAHGTERVSADAKEAQTWLDEVTSRDDPVGVYIENPDEVYSTWEEVEKFLLPETLLSIDDTESEEEDYNEDLENSFNALDVSDETSMSSSHSLEDPPKTPQSPKSAFSTGSYKYQNGTSFNKKAKVLSLDSPDRTARNSVEFNRPEKSPKGSIPPYLRPLFNHTLWRIHNDSKSNPAAALESFILLTNDPTKQQLAQKFGIRAKRLDQLRDAVGREDREYKNRLTVYKMETEGAKPRVVAPKAFPEQPAIDRPKSSHSKEEEKEDEIGSDEDVVLLKRAPRGPQAQTANNQRVLDPNDFGRANQHYGGRGGRGGIGGPRGRGGTPRGRGGFVPRGAYTPPTQQFRPPPAPTTSRTDPNQPIDPDSFARPMPRASNVRGTRRKLWEPN
ncbi:hypothetical protein CC78DRAFT_125448 [Lojkania enalia]|uniref:PIN domain-containing protein n=1 Tax=Lojkania enalia TaxID=147567 RepID=A0A9P4MUZ0_9PLEO|nr:hypothetical protein CC78DRAFT_125448 [Didymosphaeria enalia]